MLSASVSIEQTSRGPEAITSSTNDFHASGVSIKLSGTEANDSVDEEDITIVY
jgi:hypothetical protein